MRVESEKFEELFRNEKIKVKRITSPKDFSSETFESQEDEWVYVISGHANLKIGEEVKELKTGDSVFIPKNTPNQVVETFEETAWLGIYL
ncbi:cupin domain-containing protein [Candidatus Parcubacteria bacterium]|nr:cupin domain-containing protein [Candidatus Parcubacteria bacterium]